MATTVRASLWSVTINNPTPADDECLALAQQKGWKVEGQIEKGEKNGVPHYQMMVRTPQVRFSAIKKQFPRAHIEPARNALALSNYVTKEETRVGNLPVSQEKYPSLSALWKLIYQELTSISKGVLPEDLDWDKMDDKKRLAYFDQAIEELIYKGYHVETIGVNPQTRSAFARFARPLLVRAAADIQTDRQRVQDAEQHVEVDTITLEDASDEEEGSVSSSSSHYSF